MFCWKKTTSSWYYKMSMCLFHLSSGHFVFSLVIGGNVSKKWVQKTLKEVRQWSNDQKRLSEPCFDGYFPTQYCAKTCNMLLCVSIAVFLTHVRVIHVYTKLWYQKGATNYLSLISLFIDVFLWFWRSSIMFFPPWSLSFLRWSLFSEMLLWFHIFPADPCCWIRF